MFYNSVISVQNFKNCLSLSVGVFLFPKICSWMSSSFIVSLSCSMIRIKLLLTTLIRIISLSYWVWLTLWQLGGLGCHDPRSWKSIYNLKMAIHIPGIPIANWPLNDVGLNYMGQLKICDYKWTCAVWGSTVVCSRFKQRGEQTRTHGFGFVCNLLLYGLWVKNGFLHV